jgi:TfoX/Sxy family transcriptional regulator of competence genes
MPMHLPRAARPVIELFEAIRPSAPDVTVRSVFGQPAAFVRGNMFLGVFGDSVFLRLDEDDRKAAQQIPGAHLFEPMPGRAMREYVVLPADVLASSKTGGDWIDRSLRYATTLDPKTKRGRNPPRRAVGRSARGPARRRRPT